MKAVMRKVGRVAIYTIIIVALVAPWAIAVPIFNLLGI